MALVNKADIGTPLREEACFKRVMINTGIGFAAGLVGAWGLLVFKRPSADPRLNPAKLYRQFALEVAPMTTAGALLFTGVSCAMESSRGKDWRNAGVAGALTGSLVVGIKKRSGPAALVGAVIFGAAAAVSDSTDSFNATPEETESKLPSASRTMVGANSPGLYAAQAYHSQKLSAKLQ